MKAQYFFSRAAIAFLLIIGISVALHAQQQRVSRNEPSPDRLRQHVTYLASEALAGRRTGTPGADDAAHYVAHVFARLGLRHSRQTARAHKSSDKAIRGFLQPFPYVAGVELGKKNTFTFSLKRHSFNERTGTDGTQVVSLLVGTDWMPLGSSSNSKLESLSAVFVNYGITSAELNHNDYAEKDVAGKIVVARNGTPDGDNPHGQFARYEDVRWKAIAARNAGAKALIVISKEDDLKRIASRSFAMTTQPVMPD